MSETTKEITRNQYLQIVGLLTLARHHKSFVDGCEQAMCEIIEPGADEYAGHCGDAIWSGCEAGELLRRLEVTVVAAPPEAE